MRQHTARMLGWGLVLLLMSSGAEVSGVAAAPPAPAFLATNGYLVTGPFLAFYEANGGAATFGEPHTDAFSEADGLTVQYFAFACLEWRGDHMELRHLGRMAAQDQPNAAAFAWLAPDMPVAAGRTYLPAAGHTIGGALGWYWQTHGATAILGLPLSEEIAAGPDDRSGAILQYFERAVLRYDPAAAGTPDEVRREPLGSRFAPERPTTPAPRLLAEASLPARAGSPEAHNLAVAAAHLHGIVVTDGAPLSFLGRVGPVTAEHDYEPGAAIVGGQVVRDNLGGGICLLSTLLYRAAWHAGLPMLTRQAHSLWLNVFADAPGLEAAVAEPGPDLVLRNDTGAELIVEAYVAEGRVTLRLWGRADGRQVTVLPPDVQTLAPTAEAEPSRVVTLVVNERVIRPLGGPARRERVVTRYTVLPVANPTPTPV